MLRGKRAVSRVDGVLTSGRIFCGKPPKSAIADLGNIECRSRVNPRSVSTPDQVRGRLFPENALMTRLTIERPPVAPIGELCRRPFRIGRARKLGEDPPKIAFGLALIAGERPAFGEAGEIFTAIVLAELVEG